MHESNLWVKHQVGSTGHAPCTFAELTIACKNCSVARFEACEAIGQLDIQLPSVKFFVKDC